MLSKEPVTEEKEVIVEEQISTGPNSHHPPHMTCNLQMNGNIDP